MRTATCARTGRCAHTRWRVLAPSARRQRAAPRPSPTTVTHHRISRLSSRDLTMLTRATNKGGDPFDMSGLSDAERAAMRQEWSLECRQAGLDHLSESFKKPSVLNPRDDAILPFVENNSMPDPIEALVSTVDATSLTPDLDRKLAFLNGEGVDTVAHTGNGKFDAHLIGVASVLKAWGCDQSVVDAGLFHSIYGTEGFQGFCLPYERRDDVRSLIGDRAEYLVHTFCSVDRLSVDNDLGSEPGGHGFRSRPELPGGIRPIDVSDQSLWFDFITLTLADWLEQVEGASTSVNTQFEWHRKGDAWGYRRGAYAKMAEIVGAEIPDAMDLWRSVYSREHPRSRHISQPVTPPMCDAARHARLGLEQPAPRYP